MNSSSVYMNIQAIMVWYCYEILSWSTAYDHNCSHSNQAYFDAWSINWISSAVIIDKLTEFYSMYRKLNGACSFYSSCSSMHMVWAVFHSDRIILDNFEEMTYG